MVAGTHWLASATGMGVLERGGNAFDAAVAAGFVLQVAEPHLNGPGGEVPILLWSEAEQRAHVVCGQGVAPAAATIEKYAELGLAVVPGTGLLAATVPGAFGGWMLLLERWGTWRLADVLAPAIHYAEHGVPVLERISATIASVEGLFTADWPTSAATWLPGGQVPAPGSKLANPVLAATYRRVVAEAEAASATREGQLAAARRAWYEGFVAEAVAGFSASTAWRDSSGEVHGGLLTGDDLAGWRATVEEPAAFDYRGHTVLKTGPWGQGPVFLQQLALLDGVDLDAMGYLGADYVHTVTEAAKLAFADREAWYGDTDVPLADLLDPAYNADRRALIGAEASLELRPGSPGGRTPRLPVLPEPGTASDAPGVSGARSPQGVGEPTVGAGAGGVEQTLPDGQVRGDTCHVDVVDRWGNMVSATPSGGWLQSSPTIPSLGFCLGTRAQMFWLQEGLPASLRPGARPRTTLSPSLALRDGRPWLAFGTPGGDQQDQWSVNFFLAVVHGGLNLQEAVDAPMFHSEHFPSSFFPRGSRPGVLHAEERLDPGVVAELRRRGHEIEVQGPWSLGRLSAVARDGGFLKAAANPRGAQGYAAGR
ncbi:gamma-glutamyltransferase family protein [Actinomadura sp. ATCC 31491]|uniref:Gamma-glutamyltransferase family protein n=1 Tax=Actinomadura luzonensis TaxID=2805427 RepID=A0ABT0G5D7_9ACTN|nr:gamma-glutamyltransferase family protein [Actinomadura luzonensis]MCK2219822.1 gamma-glutamyltransferase family protein [Actinomadura luzonensis]